MTVVKVHGGSDEIQYSLLQILKGSFDLLQNNLFVKLEYITTIKNIGWKILIFFYCNFKVLRQFLGEFTTEKLLW